MRIKDLQPGHLGKDITLIDDGFTAAGTLNGYTLNVTHDGNPTRTIARVEASVTIGALTHELTPHHTIELRTHGPFSEGGIIGSQHEGQDFTAPEPPGHPWDNATRGQFIKEHRERIGHIVQRDAAAREARWNRTITEASTPDEASQRIARHFAKPNGYVCMHGMSDQAEDHQDCDRPNREEQRIRTSTNAPRLNWDRQPQPTSWQHERRNPHTGQWEYTHTTHACKHGHSERTPGHEHCERLNDDLPHLHFEFDPTPHPPRQRPTQAILRTLRRITSPRRNRCRG